jgi:hypothetical protein
MGNRNSIGVKLIPISGKTINYRHIHAGLMVNFGFPRRWIIPLVENKLRNSPK